MSGPTFSDGSRVQTHPATDAWMRGERYGTVVRTVNGLVRVRLDVTARERRFRPDDLQPLASRLRPVTPEE